VGSAACASPAASPRERTDQSSEELQSYGPDPGDPQVGILMRSDGWACTGTLIAPDVVLTEAVCANLSVLVGFSTAEGGSVNPPSSFIPAIAAASPVNQFGADCTLAPEYQVALVRLAQPVQGVPLWPYAAPDEVLTPYEDCDIAEYGGAWPGSQFPFLKFSWALSVRPPGPYGDSFIGEVAKEGPALVEGSQGAPVVCNGVITGITPCAFDYDPYTDVHVTRLAGVSSWITSQLTAWECDAGATWDRTGAACVHHCPAGWYWDYDSGSCVKSIHCPVGSYWDGDSCVRGNPCHPPHLCE
jgi:hypothetical protein